MKFVKVTDCILQKKVFLNVEMISFIKLEPGPDQHFDIRLANGGICVTFADLERILAAIKNDH